MKVGDLVKWTHPHAKDIGIILDIPANSELYCGQANIHWFGKPEHSGLYPLDHELLESLDESR